MYRPGRQPEAVGSPSIAWVHSRFGEDKRRSPSQAMTWRNLPRQPQRDMWSQQKELSIRSHAPSPHRVRTLGGTLVRALVLTLICALAGPALAGKDKPPVQYQIPIPPPPDFSALDWLQGQWTGKTVPTSPSGEVQLSVTPDLEKHFLVFRGDVSLAATSTVPAVKESWIGILSPSPDGTGFILRIFSSTGFITRYRMTVNDPELHLNPEGGDSPPPGWLFRMTWARTGPDEFTETVRVAPPGKTFFDYYTAKFARVPPPAKTNPAP